MSATILSDPMMISSAETQPSATNFINQSEIEFIKCDCCGLSEECTLAYIERIRERFAGKWICGLCSEAVKDEIIRTERLISSEEALNEHMNFCKNFKSSVPPSDPTIHLITVMRQILRRGLDSPRALRSSPSSPTKKDEGIACTGRGLARSESCFSSLSG